MKRVFQEVNTLDKKCYEQYFLNEDILQEHAAMALYNYLIPTLTTTDRVLIVAGAGNNGADGIALARILQNMADVTLVLPNGVKSEMAKIQLKRFEAVGGKVSELEIIENYYNYFGVVVDCLFGSGLNKELDSKNQKIIKLMNKISGNKIACDIPSGIDIDGNPSPIAFNANVTITMGAYKKSLFGDNAKDFVGKIIVANLGVSRALYERNSNIFLLEKGDMELPFRTKKNTHKGEFGHVCIISGEKEGASILAAKSALCFGAGLVTLLVHEKLQLPYSLMQSHKIPQNCTAIAMGMGLGNYSDIEVEKILSTDIPKVIDADLFYEESILRVLDSNVVLTPHPKEFCSLLKLCKIADIDIDTLQKNRFFYVNKFCQEYPNIVLLLKGANTLIGQADKIYINRYGSQVLSKGGSGDVLSGLIASLLAQNYSLLDAAITASLTHTLAGNKYQNNNYSMMPEDLIQEIKKL